PRADPPAGGDGLPEVAAGGEQRAAPAGAHGRTREGRAAAGGAGGRLLSAVASFLFLTPSGALVAAAVAVPLAAAGVAAWRRARVCRVLELDAPSASAGATAELLSLAAVPLLLALAAANPAVRTPEGHAVLKNTQAIFVLDVSRSMAAAAGPHSPTRL